jgi:glycosyltransferase involved in cell wall biosynthesis
MGGEKSGGRPPLHVLIIAPTPFFADRGCHVRIFEEIRAIQARGCRVTVCTYHFGRDIGGVVTRRSLRVPWYSKLAAGPSLHKFYVDPLLAMTVLRTCRRDRPDVIHAHLHEGIAVGWPAARLFRLPLIADLQGSLTGELLQHGFFSTGSGWQRCFERLERALLRLPSAFILSSPGAVRGFSDQVESLGVPVRTIVDGVDTSVFYPALPGEGLRGELSLPEAKKIVGFLGVLNEYQGAGVLLRAAQIVLQQSDDVCFLIMGYPNVNHYRRMAADMEITDRVTFTGRIPYEQARDYLSACDVGVSPKQPITEANGKLLNYMAVGIPVVATDTPINREVLRGDGLYADVDDPESLADALLKALRDDALARLLGERLRRRAVAELSWEAGGEAIVELYASLTRT